MCSGFSCLASLLHFSCHRTQGSTAMLCTSEGLYSVKSLQRVQRLLMLGHPPALLCPQLLLRSWVELAAAVNTNLLSDYYA